MPAAFFTLLFWSRSAMTAMRKRSGKRVARSASAAAAAAAAPLLPPPHAKKSSAHITTTANVAHTRLRCADGACGLVSPATFSFAKRLFMAESKSDTASKLPAFAPAAPPTCRIDKAELASMRATLGPSQSVQR